MPNTALRILGAPAIGVGLLSALLLAPAVDAKLLKSRRVLPEPDKEDRETIIRLQIFLDEEMFGPGKIDGAIGQFTRKAVAHFNFKHGLQHDNYYKVVNDSEEKVKELYTTYTVEESAFEFIANIPSEPSQQAEVPYLAYRSIEEFIAERYHTDERFLARINPEVKWSAVRAGAEIKVPNVTPFRIEDIEKHQKFEEDEALSKRLAIVDTSQKLVAIWEGEDLIATFPVTPGQEKFIHRGSWTMRNMVTTPEFRWDRSMLDTGQRSDTYYQLPPGPNSPVGIFWAGLSKAGIGLHGTAYPHTIGRSRSAGCVRLANWDAVRLSGLIRPGATVEMR